MASPVETLGDLRYIDGTLRAKADSPDITLHFPHESGDHDGTYNQGKVDEILGIRGRGPCFSKHFLGNYG